MVTLSPITNTENLREELLRRSKEHFDAFRALPTRVVVGSLNVARWLDKVDPAGKGKTVMGLAIVCGDGLRAPCSFVVC